ncbi:phage major capsid protein [Siphonobacter sp. BAB-5385]|uniref:phage major capsid protein n=1 Tax=Siphonobacter sp. BAB-5385 TaxID=1864822 RepID=UPI000B9E8A8A|nr:phage major capsid protein [Siphonobacter sp. BAB-5385]OZI06596.1 phage major capsid protein [Siphonobacter sp. BAB-5385]
MKRNLTQVKDLMAAKIQERDAIRTAQNAEKRELTDEERGNLAAINQSLSDLKEEEKELLVEEAEARGNQRSGSHTHIHLGEGGNKHISERDQRDLDQFSLGRVIRSKLKGTALSGIDAEVIEEGFNEARTNGINPEGNVVLPYGLFVRSKDGADMIQAGLVSRRDMTATGQTTAAGDQGGQLITTSIGKFYQSLYNKIVLQSMGATFMTGLTGNIALPRFVDNDDPNWKAENADADKLNPTIVTPVLSPKRLAAYVDISNQLLNQSEINIDLTVRTYLINKLSSKFDAAGINGSGANNQPRGILQTAGIGAVFAGGAVSNATNANGAAVTWKDVVNLYKEIAIDNADLGRLGYLLNPKVVAAMQVTPKIEGSDRFIMEEGANTLNGFKIGVTNNVPSNITKGTTTNASASIFGNWQDFWMGIWGGVDILVNPYSLDTKGETRINAALYGDCAVARPESFAAIKDIIA